MNIQEAKEEIINTFRAYHRKDEEGRYRYPISKQRPILLIGPPGIGKTAIMEQIAQECEIGLVAYTITHHTRQSAIGLPRIVEREYEGTTYSVTEYTMSEIIASVYECMEKQKKKEGILFLDEINCVSETLAPTMLQFLQNKMFGTHKIPDGWMIVAAGNPIEYNKSVREFDIVTLDRVRSIEIETDCAIWLKYAQEAKVHGAVLSYLRLKPENFYRIENTVDGKFFVTARGWEDLSELLKSYEELQIPASESQMAQFLQKEEIARDFSVYYRLYQKYGTDYEVDRILNTKEEEWEEKTALLKKSGFEERFIFVNLLLEYLYGRFEEQEQTETKLSKLYELLSILKLQLKDTDGRSKIEDFVEKQRESLVVKEKMELLRGRELSYQKSVVNTLERYLLFLKEYHIENGKLCFEEIKKLFLQDTEKNDSIIEKTKKELELAFEVLEICFGNGQEMILFLTGLTEHKLASAFISMVGCDAYFRYSEQLFQRREEKKLQEECRKLLKWNQ